LWLNLATILPNFISKRSVATVFQG
jgi:hypothetical protein